MNFSTFNETSFTATPNANKTDHSGKNDYFVIPKDTYDQILEVVFTAVLPPIVVFGLVGNVITLLVLRLQQPRTPTLYLQLSLATADTFFLLSTVLFTAVKVTTFYDKKNGANIANLLNPIFFAYFNQLPVRISHLIIGAIAIERTIAVFMPLKSRRIWTKKVSLFAIAFGIVLPALVTFPRLFQYRAIAIVNNVTSEISYKSVPTKFGNDKELFGRLFIATIVCFNILPVCVVFVCNTAIIIGLFKRKRTVLATFGSEHYSRIKEDDSVTKTLLIINIVFFICLMPTAVHIIITSLDTEHIHPRYRNNLLVMLAYFAMVLDVFNSAVNCIIYVVSSSHYRGRFKSFICCKDFQQKGTNYAVSQNNGNSPNPEEQRNVEIICGRVNDPGKAQEKHVRGVSDSVQDRGMALFVYQ